MKKLCLILVFVIFACKSETKFPENYIDVFYHRPGISYPMSWSCDFIGDEKLRFTKLEDESFLKKFLSLYNSYEIDTTRKSVDVRIHLLVHQKNKIDTLCLGENFGTVKNGVYMKDSKELLNLVKAKIDYDN